MQIQLEGKFQYLEEREVVCPLFDERHVFTIRRIGYEPYQRVMKENLEARKAKFRGVQDSFFGARAKAQSLATMKGLKGKIAEDFIERTAEEAVMAIGDDSFAGVTEAVAEVIVDAVGPIAEHLIARATGFKSTSGDELEYSVDLGKALLEVDAPYPDDYEDGEFVLEPGIVLGEAIRLWVLHESQKTEEYQVQQVEDASKN